jgi:hypothetical protein
MKTIGQSISGIRNKIKAVKQDSFVTDRMIYGSIYNYASLFLSRQDARDRLGKYDSIYQILPFVELVEVDKIEAECFGVTSNCYIKRTAKKLPELFQGYNGPLIRTVSSIDSSLKLEKTYPRTFTSIANSSSYKYNKAKYYWFLNNYLYFPNLDWDAIRIEGIFNADIGDWGCDPSEQCKFMQEKSIIPDALFAEIESMVLRDFGVSAQFPEDANNDKQNLLR